MERKTGRVLTASLAVTAAAVLAACGGASHSSRSISPSESAAVATARADAQAYVGTCVPKDAGHQILLGRSLLTKDGRQKLAVCLAIPKENRPKFEAAVLAAAEHVKWTDKAQRHAALFVTLPALAGQYHVSPVASIPGVTVTPTATVAVTPSASRA